MQNIFSSLVIDLHITLLVLIVFSYSSAKWFIIKIIILWNEPKF